MSQLKRPVFAGNEQADGDSLRVPSAYPREILRFAQDDTKGAQFLVPGLCERLAEILDQLARRLESHRQTD